MKRERDSKHPFQSDADAIRADWEAALRKYEVMLSKKSPLEMTAVEMSAVGTPPSKLLENPQLTWGETMSDEEILAYLRGLSEVIQGLLKSGSRDSFSEIQLRTFTTSFKLSIGYLFRIGRLPTKYKP